MLVLNNISFKYADDKTVIENISFEVKPSEVLSIVGASGVGKSTLLNIIAGKLQAYSGDVFLEGERLKSPNEQLIAGHEDVMLVSQEFELDAYFTVFENISNRLLHLVEEKRIKTVQSLIKLLDLGRVEHNKSGALSGGEKQRLAFACALATEPKILLLDEPFSHLDVHLRQKVGKYLKKKIAQKKMAVILVTHEGSEALSWSTSILFIEKGKLKRKYSPEQAYLKPKNIKEGRYFGELNSIVKNGKQKIFRPTQFALEGHENDRINVEFFFSEFRGPFYANYFKIESSNKKIVLYHSNQLRLINHIYV